ncbi:MAG TPA: universal stress protein [Longimicrobium sp.]|nr:universal stress protein [Longimicrobium sp.]
MTERIRTIVVGVQSLEGNGPDEPGGQEPALASSVDLARLLGARLHVVHACEPPASALPRGCLPPADPGSRAAHAAAVARRMAALTGRFPDLEIEGHAVEGSPALVLCDVAARVGADLLVVGSSPRERLWRRLLGSTTEGVVRGASVPVLVVHEPLRLPLRRILLTTDLSDESAAVLKRGVRTAGAAATADAALRLLLAVSFEPRIPRSHWEEMLVRASEEALGKVADGLGIHVETRIRAGEAGWQVVHEAEEWKPDLLVMGVHGRSGLRRLWLGGTAAAVLRGTPCNVLAVPAAAAVGEARDPARRDEFERESVLV